MEVMEELPNDGKSPLWHIERRMVMDPNYNLPDRHTLNRMYAIISMDRDICLHTEDNFLIVLWDAYGLPSGTIANGEWGVIQRIAESDYAYNSKVAIYQDILKRRNTA